MPLTEDQIATREYLAERYGATDAALMMSLYELESNSGRKLTNKVSSAAGQFQIIRSTWGTIANHVKRQLRSGALTIDDLPDGMTVDNMDDFDMHKFDFVDNAFFAHQNMGYIEQRYVTRANRARSKNGQPPISSFSELTDDPAMRMFMIAGGHKDGPDIGSNGAGFGNMINPQTGEIDIEYGMQRYGEARGGGTGNDGKGHVFTYAAYASDKAIESVGGKKLQFTPSQIARGMQYRYNRRFGHKEMKPWLDRAQQMDPGIDPDGMSEDQIYERIALFDDTEAYGANDVLSTGGHEVLNDPVYKEEGVGEVSINETRRFSDDPAVAREQQLAVSSRARTVEDLTSRQQANIALVGDTEDTQASGDPQGEITGDAQRLEVNPITLPPHPEFWEDGIPKSFNSNDPELRQGYSEMIDEYEERLEQHNAWQRERGLPEKARDDYTPVQTPVQPAPAPKASESDNYQPTTGQRTDGGSDRAPEPEAPAPVANGVRNPFTGQIEAPQPDVPGGNPTRSADTDSSFDPARDAAVAAEPSLAVAKELEDAREELIRAQTPTQQSYGLPSVPPDPERIAAAEQRVAAAERALEDFNSISAEDLASSTPQSSGPTRRDNRGAQEQRRATPTSGPTTRGNTGKRREFRNEVIRDRESNRVNALLEEERNRQIGLTDDAVGRAEEEFNKIRRERLEDTVIALSDVDPIDPQSLFRTSTSDILNPTQGRLSNKELNSLADFSRGQADPEGDRITAGERIIDRQNKGNGDLRTQISRSFGTNFDEQDEASIIEDALFSKSILDSNIQTGILADSLQGNNNLPDIAGTSEAARKLALEQYLAGQLTASTNTKLRGG